MKMSDEFRKKKLEKLEEISKYLENSKITNFHEIQKLSVSEGGFMENKYRKLFYQKLFNLLPNDCEYFLKFIEGNFLQKRVSMDKLKREVFEIAEKEEKEASLDENIEQIKKDLPRTLTPFDVKDKYSYFLFVNTSKKELDYKYYQGCLYALMYFQNLYKEDSSFFLYFNQRFSELYLKDNFTISKQVGLGFVQDIFFDFLGLILENNVPNPEAIMILNPIDWILSLFLRCFPGCPEKSYRILDFLVCNRPYTVYILSCFVIKSIIKDIKAEGGEIDDEVFIKYKDLSKRDFEPIIKETYEFMNKNEKKIWSILEKQHDKVMYLSCRKYIGTEAFFVGDGKGYSKPMIFLISSAVLITCLAIGYFVKSSR